MPVLAGADHPEASRVHRAHDRAQDGHREQEELHRGADTAGQERSDRPPGWLQQGGLTGNILYSVYTITITVIGKRPYCDLYCTVDRWHFHWHELPAKTGFESLPCYYLHTVCASGLRSTAVLRCSHSHYMTNLLREG